MDFGGLAMHHVRVAIDSHAKRVANGLMAKTNAKQRNLASKGNPSTAFELFLLSLFQEEGAKSKTLPIKLFPLLKTTEIQKLDDMSCFVLSSIVLHQEIRFSELCRSLQIGSEIIQSICKNLVDMDIVVLNDQEYMVRSIWYPWVERVLLQKRFISMRL